MKLDKYKKPEYYRNRELSWVSFNNRVLSEARNPSIPLFERLKFLSITASNLDEFFMIRVASLKDMVHAAYTKGDISGMTPKEQLEQLHVATHRLVELQYQTYNSALLPALDEINIQIIHTKEALTEEEKEYLDAYFEDNIYPVLTPMAMDSSRPFPLIRNKTLNIGALLKKKDGKKAKEEIEFATVQVPSVLPRMIELPKKENKITRIILLEQVIQRYIEKLFLSYDVVCSYPYRIMRNADLSIDEDEAEDLLKEIQKQIKKRQWGEVIRLEVNEKMDKKLLKILKAEFLIKDEDIFKIPGPLDLTFLMKLYNMKGFEKYKLPMYKPVPVKELATKEDVFTQIRAGDVLLQHPYDSFDYVVNFVKEAALDKKVLAIKQTLYRVSGDSPIIAALAKAAENGKQVTVLVELKARFDEENNIVWAKMLEQSGCHVIYGLLGLKTHSKITLVVRREEGGIRRYVHLGTGNYNDSTAKLYTDCGLLTCSEEMGEDATAIFNMLSGYSKPDSWNRLIVAPTWMRSKFLELIYQETLHAKEGKKAYIIAKMNSICDPTIMAALYQASSCGVKIDLIIRGICCMKVGIPGISDNIRIRSIVGNFLEHSRIFYFYQDGEEEVFMGSADWMPRNLDKRVEIVFPIMEEKLKKQVIRMLTIQLKDNVKAHELQRDGNYLKADPKNIAKKDRLDSQEYYCQEAMNRIRDPKEVKKNEIPVPIEPLEGQL